jgi:hypothetical protein
MNPEEALKIIKQLIDSAVQRGLFQDAESVLTVTNAFNTVAQAVTKKDE